MGCWRGVCKWVCSAACGEDDSPLFSLPSAACARELTVPTPRGGRSHAVAIHKVESPTRYIDESYDVLGMDTFLGSGSYSTVCQAVCKTTNERRAVKKIPKNGMENVEKFQREIELTSSLRHPNVARFYDSFEEDSTIYLVVELCSGGELLDQIVELPEWGEAQAGIVMQQIIRAVDYVHGEMICHRDIKPEHFIYSRRGPLETTPLKLIDFGLSRQFAPGEVLTTSAGTPLYAAPEVIGGQYGPPCDLWSCGVILYLLLSGQLPFDAETARQVVKRVRKGKYSLEGDKWNVVSDTCKYLIKMLLEKDPAARITAEQALDYAWIKDPFTQANGASLGGDVVKSLRRLSIDNRCARASLQRNRHLVQQGVA